MKETQEIDIFLSSSCSSRQGSQTRNYAFGVPPSWFRSGNETGDERQMRRTNPIWPGWPGRGKGGREAPPGHDGAKQTQFGPRQNEGQVPCRKRVMIHRTCNRLRQNKAKLGRTGVDGQRQSSHVGATSPESGMRKTNPIHRFRIADCAKQSQLPEAEHRGGVHRWADLAAGEFRQRCGGNVVKWGFGACSEKG